MDIKAIHIMEHYKLLITKKKFNEYDMLGFLIFIRETLYLNKSKYNNLLFFSDAIAHRNKNKGIAIDSITSAYNNNYILNKKGKVKDYQGIQEKTLIRELETLMNEINVKYDKYIIKDIIICIFSLMQFVQHTKNGLVGEFNILIDCEGFIALTTSVNEEQQPQIRFSKIGKLKIPIDYNGVFFFKPIELRRINDKLMITYDNKQLLLIEWE